MLEIYLAAGFFVAGIAAGVFGFPKLAAVMASKTWPSVPGSVSKSGMRTVGGPGGGRGFEAEIQAVYEVDGIVYACRRVNPASGLMRSADDAQAVLDRYPAGASVPVYYNPANPRESLLEPGFARAEWILPALSALFLTLGVVILLRVFNQSGR